MLKRVQRWIKSELVDQIPIHDAAHGFRRSRGVVTAARPHVGKGVVLRMDLKDFFGSVSTGRVRNLLTTWCLAVAMIFLARRSDSRHRRQQSPSTRDSR